MRPGRGKFVAVFAWHASLELREFPRDLPGAFAKVRGSLPARVTL